jgi:uncharacterized protein YbgA (DUF1722 family)/uncharacterized protein YbbK (DUF523 family)
MEGKIKLGISSCLLGNNVRYDNSNKWDRFLTDTLGQYVEYISVCPEFESGLGVPREPVRQVGNPLSPRLVTTSTKIDHTDRMVSWAKQRVRELEQEDLSGFIFKTGSPSSGMERIKVFPAKGGMPSKKGVGIFARIFMEHFPRLPVEEDGRLHDVNIRENFIERIFTLQRWRDLQAQKKKRGALVKFHTRHKLLLLSHSTKHYQLMGRLVAGNNKTTPTDLFDAYEVLLLEALNLKSTQKKHANVLQHMMGYFKKDLTSDEKQELLDVIDRYRTGLLPLIVPITLINHYVRKYDQDYLKDQLYLNPHPIELQLRNHV